MQNWESVALQSLSSKFLRKVRETRSSWSIQDSLDLLTLMVLELIWIGLLFAAGAIR